MSILVVDVGTSSVRTAVVRPDGTLTAVHQRSTLPSTPMPGLVELDATALAAAALDLAQRSLADAGATGTPGAEAISGVGIANQRASTVVWDRSTGEPLGPGLGWQDLRTVFTCLELQGQGLHLAPNQSATKLAAILDLVDPDRSRSSAGELAFGTLDSWIAWTLAGGHSGARLHVSDTSNVAVTGLYLPDASGWDRAVLDALRIPEALLPVMVDSSGEVGPAAALPGSPPIAGMIGDQQASLVGQGCTRRGLAKATFGTGGMLDLCVGAEQPPFAPVGEAGTFPIVAWQRAGRRTWGVEAMMLSAGTCVEWLRDDLGVLSDAADSAQVAGSCEDTGDVWFVPALLGLGTPVWDFGARGTLLGLTRGTGRPQLVRAALEGVAHRGADLVEAAQADTGLALASLRVDGGMSANPVFLRALADASGLPVEVSPYVEATTVGAAYMAGMATGVWSGEDEIAQAWSPSRLVEPALADADRLTRRARWLEARSRAERTLPDLSELKFF